MKKKTIPVEESFKHWRKDPEYVAAYDALEEEFAQISASISARTQAEMTQEEAMKQDLPEQARQKDEILLAIAEADAGDFVDESEIRGIVEKYRK